MTDWLALAAEKQARYSSSHGALDERAVVRLGNAAYAAGLALLMARSADAGEWLLRAALRWRASWDLGPGADSWGRPVGALKASVLARDADAAAELARWTLGLETVAAASPIGRYAGALALLVARQDDEARDVAATLCARDDFPGDVGDALVAIGSAEAEALSPALASVVRSFETRDDYLEDVAVADTALVLHALARIRGLACVLPQSSVLPPV